jgi:microcystin-dependent protein
MNKIDFSHLGGFPRTQYTNEFMQSSYRGAFAALASLIGDKAIISGVVATGGNVSDGWISVAGELLPFIGGPLPAGATVIIQETSEDRLFEDGAIRPVYFTRVARIGSPDGFPFADLKRARIGQPLGIPEMWAGQLASIPEGYGLADGTMLQVSEYPDLFAVMGNIHGGDGVGTFALPDLRSRFIVGYNSTDVDYNAIGNKAGSKTHQLTIGEMPKHRFFTIVDDIHAGGFFPTAPSAFSSVLRAWDKNDATVGRESYFLGGSVIEPTLGRTNELGNDEAFDKRPPYFTLAFILKLR